MSEHKLTITLGTRKHFGECSCGWTCYRSRERDLRREHRKHSADAVKLTAEQWRNMQESTP